MIISGWGANVKQEAEIFSPNSYKDCYKILDQNSLIPRGMGRSYGDSAIFKSVLMTKNLNHILEFNKITGIIKCESGVIIRDLLQTIIPYRWFVPVSPGTSLVSMGGALASDVHGKNHHNVGTFSNFVIEFDIMLGNGEIINVSRNKHADLFYATCGGMGLTGLILTITLKLKKIFSSYIRQTTLKLSNLETLCEKFDEFSKNDYSVAWLDCINLKKGNLKSIFNYGNHCNVSNLDNIAFNSLNVPRVFPSFFLNDHSMKLFNKLYLSRATDEKKSIVPMKNFFYPLDNLNHWNRLYGKQGFVQYQFVIPKKNGIQNLNKLITILIEFDIAPYLAVLKLFGENNNNYLSFPVKGYSLALDFKQSKKLIKMINKLDKMIVEFGGKIYLTKDSFLKEDTFKKCYEKWSDFQNVRAKYYAIGKFKSSQSLRLGLE